MKQFLILFFVLIGSCIFGGNLTLSTLQLETAETHLPTTVEYMEDVRQIRQYFTESLNQKWSYDSNHRGRYLFGTVFSYFSNYFLALSSATVVHEVGHAQIMSVFGGTTSLETDTYANLSIWELYIQSLTTSDRAYTSSTGYYTDQENALIAGAGMNANTDYSRWINRESLLTNQVSFVDVVDYTVNRLNVWLYFLTNLNDSDPQGDPNQYVGYLNDQGIETSVNDIFLLHTIALFLSGGYHQQSSLKNVKKPTFKTIKGIPVFLPDHYVYHNATNVSYAIEGVVRLKEKPSYLSSFIYGVESSVIGIAQPLEFLVGTDRQTQTSRNSFLIRMNGAGHYFLSEELTYLKSKHINPFLRVIYGDSKTLAQQRQWPYENGVVTFGVKIPI